MSSARFQIVHRFVHDGEVNRARAMPQNPDLIATKSPSSNVLLFDRTRHPSKPTSNVAQPDAILSGHGEEGFALAWSSIRAGYLASGSGDQLVCVWDVSGSKPAQRSLLSSSSQPTQSPTIAPLHTLKQHNSGVNDVSWCAHNEVSSWFFS